MANSSVGRRSRPSALATMSPLEDLQRTLAGLAPADSALSGMQRLLANPGVRPAGLGGNPLPWASALSGLKAPAQSIRNARKEVRSMGDERFQQRVGDDKRPAESRVTDEEVRRFRGDDLEVLDLNEGRNRVPKTTWWR